MHGHCRSTADRAKAVQPAACVHRHRIRRRPCCQRFRLGAGRVARVFARVRQKGPADEAFVLLPEVDGQKGASETLRPGHSAAEEAQVQSAQVRGFHVVRRRSAQTADCQRPGLRAHRARPQRIRLLSRHAIRQPGRVPVAVQGQRKLFGNLRSKVTCD